MPIDPAIAALAPRDHNNPPTVITVSPPEDIKAYLTVTHQRVLDRYAELTKSAESMPATVDDDVASGKAGDLIKQIRAWAKEADGARDIENEPFKSGKATIDAFFKNLLEPLDNWKKKVNDRNEVYLKAKKERLAREQEAKAKQLREEAEARAAEAARAEERRLAAEQAKIEADRAAREARENTDEVEAGKLNAEAELAQAKLKKANARRDRDEPAFEAASAEVVAKQAKLEEAKADLRKARAEQAAAAEAHRKAQKEQADKEKAAAKTAGDAVVAESQADKIERKVAGPDNNDDVRVRGEGGAVSTLTKRWNAYIIDPAKVRANIAMLEAFIDMDVLRVAINKRASAGNRDVPGVDYRHEDSGLSI